MPKSCGGRSHLLAGLRRERARLPHSAGVVPPFFIAIIMNELIADAKKAIDAIHGQGKPSVEVLEALEEVFEHVDIAIDSIQDHLCEEESRCSACAFALSQDV